MSDETELPANARGLQLAATMVEVFRERYECDDREMDFVLALALRVNLLMEAGNPEAARIVMDAVGRLSAALSQIDAVRAAKTAH